MFQQIIFINLSLSHSLSAFLSPLLKTIQRKTNGAIHVCLSVYISSPLKTLISNLIGSPLASYLGHG